MNNGQLTARRPGFTNERLTHRVHYLFFLLFWLGVFSTGFAQQTWPPVFEIQSDSGVFQPDTAFFQVLEDHTGKLTFEQVQRSASFQFGVHSNPNRQGHVYWLRMRIKNNISHDLNLFLSDFEASYLDMYWLGIDQGWHHQRTGELVPEHELPDRNGNKDRTRLFIQLQPGQQTTLYQRSENVFWKPPFTQIRPRFETEENRMKSYYKAVLVNKGWESFFFDGIMIGILLLAVCYNLFIFFSIKDEVYLYFGICLFFFTLDRNQYRIQLAYFEEYPFAFKLWGNFFFILFFLFFIQSIQKFTQSVAALSRLNKLITFFLGLTTFANIIQFYTYRFPILPPLVIGTIIEVLIRVVYILSGISMVKMIRRGSLDTRFALLATLPLFVFWMYTLSTHILGIYFNLNFSKSFRSSLEYGENFCFAWMIVFFTGALLNRYNLARKRVAQQAIEKEQLEKEREIERNRIIASQNERLEQQVEERTAQLKTSLENLKATQNQLIHKEKLASLGELTAGIAHEIQNPLNFVNNFSEVSTELVIELEEEQQKPDRDAELEKELLGDLKQNLQKIAQHGGRASQIVKNMLAHSRSSSGERQASNLNALCDEYLRLAYHGLRAKDNSFNCALVTDFDPTVGPVEMVPQEIGRVLLNLFNNAFYAVQAKQKTAPESYQPEVAVRTKTAGRQVEIRVIDNGLGMTDTVKEKLFQPFFTTKPTGEGTGLGLSLSYDIITKGHNGTLAVESQPGKGSAFIIILPLA